MSRPTAEDARHGTNPGYLAGCRDTCCRTAHAAYRRNLRARQYLTRGQIVIDGTGTRRRLRALVALGWSLADLDKMMGQRRSYCSHIANADGEILAVTAERIAKVYDRLSMQFPDESTLARRQTASRNRNLARRKGWPVPLAWDNIDDPDETPIDWHYRPPSRVDQLRDLNDQGVGISEACRRLRIGRESLEKWSERHGVRHVYAEMCGREDGIREWKNQYTKGAA